MHTAESKAPPVNVKVRPLRSLYAVMNERAKNWWYHKELRRKGEVDEARRRERESIRGTVKSMRCALETHGAHLHLAPYGGTFYHSANARTSSIDMDEYEEMCVILGIPVIDTRDTDIRCRINVLNFPMVAVGVKPDQPRDDGTYHGMSYAPLPLVMDLWEKVGARVIRGRTAT